MSFESKINFNGKEYNSLNDIPDEFIFGFDEGKRFQLIVAYKYISIDECCFQDRFVVVIGFTETTDDNSRIFWIFAEH